MKTKILLLFLSISFSFLSAQNSIPQKQELLGKWVVKPDQNIPNKSYLIDSKMYDNPIKIGVEFFVGKYTGRLRIRYFQVYESKKPSRCGYNTLFPGRYGGIRNAVWYYDANTGILKIQHSKFLGGTLFKVRKSNSSELILIRT